MRVLHYEHMGVGVIIAEAQRKLGIESRVLSKAPHPFGFKEDYLMKNKIEPFNRINWKHYYNFDILHNHDNISLPSYVIKHWRGHMVQHYHDPKTKVSLYNDVPSFASVPNILRIIPEATWIPIPVDTTRFSPEKRIPHGGIRIGFCMQQMDPSKLKYIPVPEIEQAIRDSNGKAMKYPLSEIIPHNLMSQYYGQIDIWVDRIGHNFYGFSAVEAASMGIPVLAQIGENELEYVQDCPFINTDRKGVADAILSLVEDEQLRKELGAKARHFVHDIHDNFKVARLCLEEYKSRGLIDG